jgi:Tol biopolymer transport system component
MKRTATALGALFLLACLATPVAAQNLSGKKLPVSHAGNIHFPQFAPDGTQIAYEVNYPAEKRTELFTIAFDGTSTTGSPEKLVPESMASSSRYGAGKRITHGFSWAHTGPYRFAYSVSDSTGTQDIYVDNWSEMVESQGSANKNPSWDPSEARFVFSSGRTGNGDLYLWDAGMPLQLTYDEKNAELYPIFDAKGEKVAYVRQGKAGSHIFVLDVNMFTAVPLIQYEGKESTRPSFSPDGSKVAFFSNKANDGVTEFGLWVTDSRPGSTARNIAAKVHLPTKGAAYWTPDGKGVIAASNDPDAGDPVCIFPVDGGSPNCLATGTAVNRDPMLLVIDGKWRLLFTAQAASSDAEASWKELYIFDIPH